MQISWALIEYTQSRCMELNAGEDTLNSKRLDKIWIVLIEERFVTTWYDYRHKKFIRLHSKWRFWFCFKRIRFGWLTNKNLIHVNVFYFIEISAFFINCFLGVNSTESYDIETSSLSHHNHTASKQLHEATSDDPDLTEVDQLVKPSKVHVQPLHADDLLYESTKFEPGAGWLNLHA